MFAAASLPDWMAWGFWICPLAYAVIGVSVNELLSPRWQKGESPTTSYRFLTTRKMKIAEWQSMFVGNFYWIASTLDSRRHRLI